MVRETEIKYVEAQTGTSISAGPGETYPEVATLAAFDAVLVTGESQDVIIRPDIWDLGFAYYENGNWTSWAFGSGIAQEHIEVIDIPRSA